MGDTQIYFVTNQKDRAEDVTVRLRVDGKAAELWHPETGTISPASYSIEKGSIEKGSIEKGSIEKGSTEKGSTEKGSIENGRTSVPLNLGPHESVFLVFRQAATAPARALPRPVRATISTAQGAWDVSFPPNQGAPASVKFDTLTSWATHADDGVKYFSGTATYTKEINAPQSWFRPGARLLLDLGKVKEVAEVWLNGKSLGILWHPPFQADVTGALKPGANKLEIKITNLWQNRIIGDEFLPPEKRYTFAYFRPYKKDSPLSESGLLGPVTLSAVTIK